MTMKERSMTVRQAIGKIHLWLGLVSGLVVFIVGATGCMYAFSEELLDIFDRDVRFVEVADAPRVPPTEVFAAMHEVLGPEYNMYMIGFADPARAYEVWSWNKNDDEDWIGATVNPYTGEILEHYEYHDSFWSYVVHLHTSLLLPHEIGRIVVGTGTLIFIVLLISGLFLWFPANKKVFTTKQGRRSRFAITWRLSPKRLNYDLHNVLGFYMSWILIFIAVTGIVWSFPWVQQGIYWIASGGESVPDPVVAQSTVPVGGENPSMVDVIYQRVLAEHAGAHGVLIYEPATPEAAVEVYVYPDEGTFYRYAGYQYDQYTGALLHSDRPEDANGGDQFIRMNYDIHVGAILGLPGRLLAFFASLIATSLPVTGFLIWYPRWRRKGRRGSNHRPSVTTAVRPVSPSGDGITAALPPLPAARKPVLPHPITPEEH